MYVFYYFLYSSQASPVSFEVTTTGIDPTITWFQNVTTIKVDYGTIRMLECQSSSGLLKMEPSPRLQGLQECINIGGFFLKTQFSPLNVLPPGHPSRTEDNRLSRIFTLIICVGKLKEPDTFKMGRKSSFRLIQKDNSVKRELFIQLPPEMNASDHCFVEHNPNDPDMYVYAHLIFPPQYFQRIGMSSS